MITHVSDDQISQLSIQLEQLRTVPIIYETIFLKIDRLLRHATVPKFWRHFNQNTDSSMPEQVKITNHHFFRFQQAVRELYQDFGRYYVQLKRLEKLKQGVPLPVDVAKKPSDMSEFYRMFRCALLAQLPTDFNNLVYEFYSIAFKVFALTHSESGE